MFKKRLSAIILAFAVILTMTLSISSCGEEKDDKSESTAEEISETTTEAPTTTAEPTVPETTTEKPPVKTEIVYQILFDDVTKAGIESMNQGTYKATENKTLMLTCTGTDPFITLKLATPVKAEDVDIIKIKAKNYTDGWDNQLFFITDTNPGWSEGQSMKNSYMYSEGEDFEILEFYTSDPENWTDNVTKIRFDALVQEGDVEIESISFEKLVK